MARKRDRESFETALQRLEGIVATLEEGDLSLEESLTRYDEGMRLTRLCQQRLDAARKRIEVVTQAAGERLETRALGDDELEG